jgi:hypothetical protein
LRRQVSKSAKTAFDFCRAIQCRGGPMIGDSWWRFLGPISSRSSAWMAPQPRLLRRTVTAGWAVIQVLTEMSRYNLGMPEIGNPCREPLNRALTQQEHSLIRWLIEHSFVKDAARHPQGGTPVALSV